jgi:hypothetical protein
MKNIFRFYSLVAVLLLCGFASVSQSFYQRPQNFLQGKLPKLQVNTGTAKMTRQPYAVLKSPGVLINIPGIVRKSGLLSHNLQQSLRQISSHTIPAIGSVVSPEAATILKSLHVNDLLYFLLFKLSHEHVFHGIYYLHDLFTKLVRFVKSKIAGGVSSHVGLAQDSVAWQDSVLSFMNERCSLLAKLLVFNYVVKVVCTGLLKVGLQVTTGSGNWDSVALLVSRISYVFFAAHCLDMFKTKFLRTFFPKIGESKRQSYLVNKASTVAVWTVAGLAACELLSTHFHVPLSSTLAFGGVGGLAVGLSLRDITANFMGGMMLLFHEPFTPGDFIVFEINKKEVLGESGSIVIVIVIIIVLFLFSLFYCLVECLEICCAIHIRTVP